MTKLTLNYKPSIGLAIDLFTKQRTITMAKTFNQTKYLSRANIDALKATVGLMQSSPQDHHQRNALLIECLLSTGARIGEMLAVSPQDLDHEHKTILIKGSKGSNDREIPLNDNLFQRLSLYAQLKCVGDRLFDISARTVGEAWHDCRPVKKPLHSLRHTFAIETLRRHKDIMLLKRSLGHQSINNTMIYADYLFTREEFKANIQGGAW